jgi:hypothetical protein
MLRTTFSGSVPAPLTAMLHCSMPSMPEAVLSVLIFDGEFYPINVDTTAAFKRLGNARQATFKSRAGEIDTLTCSLSTDKKSMTCNGVLSNGDGRATQYVDVFDRM